MAQKTITRKISIFINGREVKNTLNGVGKEIGKVKGQLRNLTRGSEEYNEKVKELKKLKAVYKDMNDDIRNTGSTLDKLKKQLGPVGQAFVAAFSAAAIISFGNYVADTINLFRDLKHETKQLSGLTGQYLDDTVAKVKALSDTFQDDYKEILISANTLVKQLGVSYDEALDVIEKGYLAGANVSGDMLNQIKEYAPFMKEANLELEEMVALIAQTEKNGIFNDKGIDAIKEGTLRLREGSKATREAMEAIGIDANEVYAQLRDGTISYFEAIQLVSEKLGEINEQSPEVGQAIADIFGGPGEDAGLQYLKNIKNIDLNLNNLVDTTDEYTRLLKEEKDANEALNKSWVKLTSTGGVLNKVMTSLKGILAQTLEGLETIGMSSAERAAYLAKQVVEKNNREQLEDEQNQFNDYVERRKKTLGKLYDFQQVKEEYLESIRTSIQNRIDEGNEDQIKKYLKIFKMVEGFSNPDSEEATATTTPTTTPTKEPKGSGDKELTAKDRFILNSKKKLAQLLAEFEEEQRIQEEVKQYDEAVREEEAEVLRLEAKYQKMAENAGYETVVAAGLQDLQEAAIQEVRDKWANIREKKKVTADKKLLALDKETKQKEIQAEQNLENAKAQAKQAGLNALQSIFGKKTAMYKLLFGFEKAVAINEVLANSAKSVAQITANTGIANAKAVAASPLTAGQPWVGINTAASLKNIAATKLVAGTQIASILASAIKGFQTGGYTGDGAADEYAGSVHRDEYVIPKFIVQDATYAPQLQQLEQRRTEVLGTENSLPDTVNTTAAPSNDLLTNAIYALISKLNDPLIATTLIGDNEINRLNKRDTQLQQTRSNAKIGN